jgi:hypothetical protein
VGECPREPNRAVAPQRANFQDVASTLDLRQEVEQLALRW